MHYHNCKNIVFIHGSGQSGLSYNFLRIFLPEHNLITVEYDTQTAPDTISTNIYTEIYDAFGDEPFSVIAHSYGCIVGLLAMKSLHNCETFIAMSAPWGGSRTAKWLNLVFRQSKLFESMKPGSAVLTALETISNNFKIINIVTTGFNASGNDLAGMGESNDGLLTVKTQKAIPENLNNVIEIEMTTSHNEVLFNYDTVEIIKTQVFQDD
jgi:pimeloyl-ACP methyl ester carboxylesterase